MLNSDKLIITNMKYFTPILSKNLYFVSFILICFFSKAQNCNKVYTINNQNPTLLSVVNDLTGATTAVTTLGTNARALAINPLSGVIFFSSETAPYNLGTYNPLTSIVSTIGASGTSTFFDKLTFSANGTLYGFLNNSNILYTINITTGAATNIATFPGIINSALDGDIVFAQDQNDVMFGVFRGITPTQSRLYSITVTGTPQATLLGNVAGDVRSLGFSGIGNLIGFNAQPTTNQMVYLNQNNGGTISLYAIYNTPSIVDIATSPIVFNPNAVQLTSNFASCNTSNTGNSDALVRIAGTNPSDRYDIVTGSSYTGSATYSSATALPTNRILLSNLPNANATYTVRLFSNSGCVVDKTTSIVAQSCVNNCGSPGKDGPAPSTAQSVTGYNSTSLIVTGSQATITGLGVPPLAVGDKLLFIQMQGADIVTTNGVNYGTPSNITAGNYEFAIVTSVSGTGPFSIGFKNPLQNTYVNSNNTGINSQGNKRFQIIRVPQYSSMTLPVGGLNVPLWNGTTGGVLVLEVQGNIDFNGQSINGRGAGFRGGGGRALGGNAGFSNTDYVTPATATLNGTKGEGIAGTPRYLNGPSGLIDTGIEGYPGGSYARGFAANAGGGGTDGDVNGNSENSGGGGGANAGAGGLGGWGWDGSANFEQSGGLGGFAFASSSTKIVMGGGGGAGSTNNSTGIYKGFGGGFASSGFSGGGIVIITAGSVSNVGTIDVSGASWETTSIGGDVLVNNDAAGGGGAGGSVVLNVAAVQGLTNITVKADGGRGASLSATIHGPGGGGGGGAVFANGTLNSASSSKKGINGQAIPTGNFGSSSATPGVSPADGGTVVGANFGSGFTCFPPVLNTDNVSVIVLNSTTGNIFSNDINPYTGDLTGLTFTGITPFTSGIGSFVINTLTGVYSFVGNNFPSLGQGMATTTSIIYSMCNINGCTTAQVAFSVVGVNDAPFLSATPISISGFAGAVRTGSITGFGDIDNTLAQLTISGLSPLSTGPNGTINTITGGRVTISGSGLVTFQSSVPGIYTLNYQICDPTVTCTSAILTLSINGAVPVPANDNFTTNENTSIVGNLLTNDFNPNTNQSITGLTFNIVPTLLGANIGTLSVNGSGGFTFVPSVELAQGVTTITNYVYQLCNNTGCATAQVVFSVTGVNDPPVASTVGINATIFNSITGVANLISSLTGSDIDGTVTGFVINYPSSLVGAGVFVVNGVTISTNTTIAGAGPLSVTFDPVRTFTGLAQFNFNVRDNNSALGISSALYSVSVIGSNQAPLAILNTTTTSEDIPVSGILAGFSDPDGDAVSVTTFSGAVTGGTIVINANGSYTFTPTLNYNGVTTVNYNVCDNYVPSLCTSNNLVITVTSVNDAPFVSNTPLTIAGLAGSISTRTITGFGDVDNPLNQLTVSGLNPVSVGINGTINTITGGTATISGSGLVTFQSSVPGIYTLNYQICDPTVTCTSAILTISVSGTPPVAISNTTTTSEGVAVSGNVMNNDQNPNTGNSTTGLTVTGFSQIGTPLGNLSATTSGGDFTFTPNVELAQGVTTTTSFNYSVCNVSGCSTATLAITITGVNDAPVGTDVSTSTSSNTSISGTVPFTDADPNSIVTITSQNITNPTGTFTVSTTGGYSFVPNGTFTGIVSFTVNGCDLFTCTSAIVTITVTTNTLLPIARLDQNNVLESGTTTGNILTNDTNPITGNNTQLTITGITVQSPLGNVIITNSLTGAYTFVPNPSVELAQGQTNTINDYRHNSTKSIGKCNYYKFLDRCLHLCTQPKRRTSPRANDYYQCHLQCM